MQKKQMTKIRIPSDVDMRLIVGEADENLRFLENAFDVTATLREDALEIQGDKPACESLAKVVDEMIVLAQQHSSIGHDDIQRLVTLVRESDIAPRALREDIIMSRRGKVIRPKTAGQKRLVDAIRSHAITFGLGPAGTGKTFLACALAVDALMREEVGRIILTRPIVEAGENLGFLPGTIMEKVDPYMRPLYDSLFNLLDADLAYQLLNEKVIEITPLAFMRGRTFNDSFIILDEAQNTTSEQMKMFLTRLGFGSKMVVTGDESQSDSAHGPQGIIDARKRLSNLDEIAFIKLSGADVVRHSLVAKIVAAYEQGSEEHSHANKAKA